MRALGKFYLACTPTAGTDKEKDLRKFIYERLQQRSLHLVVQNTVASQKAMREQKKRLNKEKKDQSDHFTELNATLFVIRHNIEAVRLPTELELIGRYNFYILI